MGKLLVITALALAVAIDAALAQEDVLSFEVVSVRINRSGSQRQDMRLLPGGRATVTNAPLRRVILTAYGMLPQQLIGGPAWLETERFDIVAQARENLAASAPGGAPGPGPGPTDVSGRECRDRSTIARRAWSPMDAGRPRCRRRPNAGVSGSRDACGCAVRACRRLLCIAPYTPRRTAWIEAAGDAQSNHGSGHRSPRATDGELT